jgi:multimeric flavodoxin WrbA
VKVLALGGSIRANLKSADLLLSLVRDARGFDSFVGSIARFAVKSKKPHIEVTNTELCAGAALLAAKEAGAEIDFFPLVSIFPRREVPLVDWDSEGIGLPGDIVHYDFLDIDMKLKSALVEKIKSADAVILSSPVYFGDRSSVSNKIMQIALEQNLFEKKIVATVSAGAKRNGGQETTNIFHLGEALSLGAYAVGNGPTSCQYGGTVVAGDPGFAALDRLGLETCYGTGKRAAQCAKLFGLIPQTTAPVTNIVALVAMDNPSRDLAQLIASYAREVTAGSPNVRIHVLQLLDGQIERCIACGICPIPELLHEGEKWDSYACIINTQRDSMASVRDVILQSDGLLIAGLNFKDMSRVLYRYQAFTERTRFLRRNDFEFTNLPVASFVLEEVGATANPIFGLKVMTSYMRHNTIVCPPIKEVRHAGSVLESGKPGLEEFVKRVQFISSRRAINEGFPVSYKAGTEGGYNDTRLDHTVAIRY